MLKRTIKYTDWNGVEREEDFWFNLTEAELTEMEFGTTGGLSETIKKMVATQDVPTIMRLFKELILKTYGEKSADGRRFIKSEELSTGFSQTEAYSQLYMELAMDPDKASEFINGIVPQSINKKLDVKKTESAKS